MKQIDECLTKVFSNKLPAPSRKWKAFWVEHPEYGKVMYLYHYQHLVLVYDHINHSYLYEWWEKPTDKRGLDSAKAWLEKKWQTEVIDNLFQK